MVDDAAQEIGEVVRGADLVDSTPRQLLLAHLLGLPAVPRYTHVPLVLGPDGRRLAKRHGAVTLAERSILGEGPVEILGWMARSVGLAEIGETNPCRPARALRPRLHAPRADRLVSRSGISGTPKSETRCRRLSSCSNLISPPAGLSGKDPFARN